MDIKELEAQFKKIDERSKVDSVETSLEGDTESSGVLNISVKREPPAPSKDAPTSPADEVDSPSVQTETLLNVDLSDVEVSDEYIDNKIREAIANQDKFSDLPGVVIRQLPGASKNYEVMKDYTYITNLGGAKEFSITALTGFIYDRSSVPPIFWVIIDKDSLSNVPPLFHDLLYRCGGVLPQDQSDSHPVLGKVTPYRTFVRKDVDDLFLELMKKSGVKKWRYLAAYQAVRKFGGFAWKK